MWREPLSIFLFSPTIEKVNVWQKTLPNFLFPTIGLIKKSPRQKNNYIDLIVIILMLLWISFHSFFFPSVSDGDTDAPSEIGHSQLKKGGTNTYKVQAWRWQILEKDRGMKWIIYVLLLCMFWLIKKCSSSHFVSLFCNDFENFNEKRVFLKNTFFAVLMSVEVV